MPSRSALALLLHKDWRELRAARAWWIFLAACGVLTGHAFTTAVATYAEVSGDGSGPAALAQGISPLDGFLVPVLGAYALAATLLLPFVAIRLVSGEKDGGGLALLRQAGARPATMVASKFLVALGGWVVALLPAVLALGLWRALGGHLDAREVGVVLAGHLLRAAWTIALAFAAAAVTESASTAAIVALGVTLATWALDFVAAVQGGAAQRLAQATPDAALRVFERGELSAAVVGASVVVTTALLALAAQALHAPRPVRRVAWRVGTIVALAMLGVAGASRLRASADLSEDRRNSFSRADEAALRGITAPVRVEVHLAPEDPRLADLERGVLRKLRRTLPDLEVRTVSRGSSGLFAADPAYGEVWYAVGPRRAMSRSTTPPIVLQALYELAGLPAPTPANEPAYPGYPISVRAGHAAFLFYLAWPLVVLAAWWWSRRRPFPSPR